MNKILQRLFFQLSICLCCFSSAYATTPGYLTAADISYVCTGNNNYQVTLAVYAECDGEFTLENQNNYDVYIKSDELGQAFQFKVTKTTSFEVKYYCASQLTYCNGGTNRGIRKYIYTGKVDLSKFPAASDWKIYWRRDFRTSRLIHIIAPAKEPYYVETNLNTKLAPCNNSPQIDGSAIFTACIDSVSTYSLLAIDKDGDELRYSIINPRNNTTADLIYQSGYDKTNPVSLASPLSVTSDGLISMKPTKAGDFGITDILIEEYRNGVKIGSTTKGLQISTFACQNRKPSISDFPNSTTNYLNYCVGDTIKVAQTNITSTDPDNNNVHFEVDQGPGGWLSSTTGKTANANVDRIVSLADIGKNIFTISAVDDGCPTIQKNTKTYTIEVTVPPVFDLGIVNYIKCNKDSVISPTVTGGKTPFSYHWFNYTRNIDPKTKKIIGYTKSADISTVFPYATTKAQFLGLKIIDANGCSFEDTTQYLPSLIPYFSKDKFCLGLTSEFKDSSITAPGTTITSNTWDFGDTTGTFTGSALTHTYNRAYILYPVKETVTNSMGCIATRVDTIEICTPPDVRIGLADSCQKNSIYFDSTVYFGYRCSGDYYKWYVNPVKNSPDKGQLVVEGKHPTAYITYSDSMHVKITMEVVTRAKCTTSVSKVMPVLRDPRILLHDITDKEIPLVLGKNCKSPDLLAISKILENINGGKNYSWTKDGSHLNTQDPSYTANGEGKYELIFQDRFGCDDTASFEIIPPILPNFSYRPVCTPGDSMQFVNKTITKGTAKITLTWSFGDGSPDLITDATTSPKHKFPASIDYTVTVTANDTNGCVSPPVRKKVMNTYFDDVFKIVPDTVKNPICANNIIKGFSVKQLGAISHIDSIYWNYGNGQGLQKFAYPAGSQVSFSYPKSSTSAVVIKMGVRYNSDPAMHNEYCVYAKDSIKITEIFPEFTGTVIPFRNCATDTSVFAFIKDKFTAATDSNVKVNSWHWILSKQNSGNYTDLINPVINPADIVHETDSAFFKYFFKNTSTTDYDIYLHAEDENGCKYGYRAPVKIAETALPTIIKLDTVCQGTASEIKFMSSNRTPSGLPALVSYYGFDANGDHTIQRGNYESSKDTVKVNYIFPVSGDIPVKIYMYEQTNVRSSTSTNATTPTECRAVIYDTVRVRPAPLLAFKADTVCAGTHYTQFTNLTVLAPNANTADEKAILSYSWNFGDGDSAKTTEVNPKHKFASGGKKYVTLTAHTKDCSFDYIDSVYVKHVPVANFDITVPSATPGDSTNVEAEVPLYFVNKSTDGSNNHSIGFKVPDGYSWNFGDGATSLDENPTHTYNGVEVYPVKLTVTNNEGCKASRIKVADTDSRLDLPNAFSPNNDGKNDVLGLVYKLILELEEYKIYNRWGQVVFDAGNNLNATWDGKFNGVEQEVGVYVAYVKARGKYNKFYNFKKNVTLLR